MKKMAKDTISPRYQRFNVKLSLRSKEKNIYSDYTVSIWVLNAVCIRPKEIKVFAATVHKYSIHHFLRFIVNILEYITILDRDVTLSVFFFFFFCQFSFSPNRNPVFFFKGRISS